MAACARASQRPDAGTRAARRADDAGRAPPVQCADPTTRAGCARMGYVDQIVTGNEKVLYVGHVSLLSLIGTFVGGALLILVGLALAVAPRSSLAPDASMSGLTIAGFAVMLAGILVIVVGLVKRASTE